MDAEERTEPEVSVSYLIFFVCLFLEVEVLYVIFNSSVSDLRCKKETYVVSHTCICLIYLQKRAPKMHALYKRAWAYASDATPSRRKIMLDYSSALAVANLSCTSHT